MFGRGKYDKLFFAVKKLSQQQSEQVQNEKIKNNINPYFSITYIDK